MGTEFPVCVPWKSDNGGVRDDLWAYTKTWWEKTFPEAYIFTGNATLVEDDGLFRRAWAVNAAVKAAIETFPDIDVFVIADADTVMSNALSVYDAVNQARDAMVLCYAHTERWMLGPHATAHMLSHDQYYVDDAETTGPHYNTFSGVLAIGRPLWEAVGGFDQRFEGWGFEDLAFMMACGTLGKLERSGGTCYHLYHPRNIEEEEQQPHYLDNWGVWQRYCACNGDVVKMRALIDEVR